MHSELITNTALSSVVFLQHFSVFSEYFISVSIIYLLIVIVLITYNVYGLMIQKAVSECMALILFMACYLLLNDDLITTYLLTFNNSILNDYFAFFTKFIVCFSSAIYFLIIANSLKEQKLISFEYLFLILFSVLERTSFSLIRTSVLKPVIPERRGSFKTISYFLVAFCIYTKHSIR